MKVFVTGGAGFIGSHLVDLLLADGAEVRILDALDQQVHDGRPAYLSTEAEFVQGDIRNREVVRHCLSGADAVVHLAAAVGVAQSMYEIERYTSVNALGAAVVLQEAIQLRDRLEKMVVASSMSIYGEGLYRCPAEGRRVMPGTRSEQQLQARRWELLCPSCGNELEPVATPETKRLAPTSIYAIGKRDHEEMFLMWGRAYRVPVTALRFFNVYGPRQALSNPYTGVTAIFASRLLNRRSPILFEDGRQLRDFVHVRDVARSIALALEPGAADGLALNVGTGRPVTVLDVAITLSRGLGLAIEPVVRDMYRAGDIRHCFADASLAHETLQFDTAVSFEDGMRELAGWLAKQKAEDRVDEATDALQRFSLTS